MAIIEGVPTYALVPWDAKNNRPFTADNPLPVSGGVSEGGGGGGGAVTIADGADVAQGTTTDSAWNGAASGATEIALQKAIAAAALSNSPVNIILDPTAKGQQNAAGSLSVVLSTDGPFASTVGTAADAAAPDDGATPATMMAVLRRGLARWTSLLGILPTSRGAKTSALSFPVVLASDQPGFANPARTAITGTLANSGDTVVIPVDGMNTALFQFLATAAWSGTTAFEVSGDGQTSWSPMNFSPWGGGAPAAGVSAGTANVPQLFEAAVGGPTHVRIRATSAITGGPVAVIAAAANGLKSLRVGAPDGGLLTIGAQADAAATSDAGAATLMALVKRGLGRWSTLLGVLPTALGQALKAASFPVVLASDQGTLNVSQQGAIPAGSNQIGTVGLVAGTAAIGTLTASETHLGNVTGVSKIATGTITRPANTTAYASGQAVQATTAAATALAVGRVTGGTGRIPRLRLSKSGTSIANANFKIHLFTTAPATLPADQATFTPSGAAAYIGAFSVSVDHAFTDGASEEAMPDVGSYVTFACAAGSQNIYALLECRGAYTPTSGEVFTITAEVDVD